MAMTKGVMVRAALGQAPRWKRISTARFPKRRSPSTPTRGGAACPAGWPRGGDADRGGLCGPAGAFILTYDATTGEAQNTAYR